MTKITLTKSQSVALDALIAFATDPAPGFSLCTLEGYAGTGKTTLVGHLLPHLSLLRVAVMAPTNKAVGVLQEKIAAMGEDFPVSVEFGSLHSFLGLRLKEREDGSQECSKDGDCSLHEYDVAIVDECSMVSEQLFTAIVTGKRSCRVLFVGDPAQLPPVKDGKESPVFRLVENRFRLNEVVRQARENPIIAASMVIRRAIEEQRRVSAVEIAASFPPPPADAGFCSGGMETIVDVTIGEQRAGRDCRSVAWKNATVDAINRRVHDGLFPSCETPFAVGEVVIANEEFKARPASSDFASESVRIFNSEELTVASIDQGEHVNYPEIPAWRVTLERDGGARVVAFIPMDTDGLRQRINRLWNDYRTAKAAPERYREARSLSDRAWGLTRAFAPIRHTYAMTAHKSQGSTFDTALVFWSDIAGNRNDFDFNRMLYVAMTRAAKHMAIVT